MLKDKKTAVLIAIIVLVGLFLRIWGTGFGLPFKYHPDEELFVDSTFNLIRSGSPDWYGAPGTSLTYINSAIYKVIDSVSGFDKTVFEKFDENHTLFYLSTRIVYAIAGAVSLVVVFLLCNKIFKNKNIGLLSSFILAISVLHVEHSHYIRPDIIATLFILLTAYYSWDIYKKGDFKYYILSGVFLILTFITKYPAIIGIIFVITAHLYRYYDKKINKIININLINFIVFCSLFFLFVFPFIYTDTIHVLKNIIWEARSEHAGSDGLGFIGNLMFYIKGSLWYTGTFIAIASIYGVVVGLVRQRKQLIFLLGFVIIYLLSISFLSLHWHRWAIVILPYVCIFASLGVISLLKHVKKLFKKKIILYYAFTTIILLIILYPAFLRSIRQSYAFAHEDTRDISRKWVMERLPSEDTAVIEDYGPELNDHFNKTIRTWTVSYRYPDYWKDNEDASYLIVSSWIYDEIMDGPKSQDYHKNSYRELFNNKELLEIFNYDENLDRKNTIERNDLDILMNKDFYKIKTNNGPEIRIYEL